MGAATNPFPKVAPALRLEINATLLHDFGRYKNGSMNMTVGDCSDDYKYIDVQTGKEINGNVRGIFGGRGSVEVNVHGQCWLITGTQLFMAVARAIEAAGLK